LYNKNDLIVLLLNLNTKNDFFLFNN
jgi:hypothetical protein